jgi:hypothetical protein
VTIPEQDSTTPAACACPADESHPITLQTRFPIPNRLTELFFQNPGPLKAHEKQMLNSLKRIKNAAPAYPGRQGFHRSPVSSKKS